MNRFVRDNQLIISVFMSENVSKRVMDAFQNPELKPLEQLKLVITNDGVSREVSALHEHWVEKRYFLHYVAPQIYGADGKEILGAKEEWLELVEHLIHDLKWLLSLPHFKFWSHIVYKSSIMDMLVSFLQEAPPFYAIEDFPDDSSMKDSLNVLQQLVLLVFIRLVTKKESPAAYMEASFHGNLLYDYYIFTVAIMWDLCQLYGRENREIIEKIISQLFELQPLYNDDLEKSVSFLIQVFRGVEQRFEDRPVPLSGELVSLSERGGATIDITLSTLEDLIVHLLDVSSSLAVFLEIHHEASGIFHKEIFMNRIVSVYEYTIPEMYKALERLLYKDETMEKYFALKHRLDVTRVELLKLYRAVIFKTIKDILENTETLQEAEIKKHVNDYITLLSNALSEREFISDYHRIYPVDMDVDVLAQICSDVDGIKCDFILQSLYASVRDSNQTTAIKKERSMKKSTPLEVNNIKAVAGPSGIQDSQPSTSQSSSSENSNSAKSDVELASLISEVKDILPHLGEGYIERCLRHYNHSSASVINAILEDSLHPDLKELDPTLPSIPPDPMEASAAADLALGMQRLNVFDNDEFDVMTRDKIDTSRVHRGKKKGKHKNLNELLNDKSYKEECGEIYSKYSIIADNDYEDEYDDTYESHDVGVSARDEPMEMDARPFITPRVLRTREKNEVVSENEYEDENENSRESPQNDRDQFVQDPAVLRARAEQRRLSRRGGGSAKGPPAVQQKDVVGKPKGQGQEKQVVVNRDQKNTHKSTKANHSRRSGAQWKRKQGMVPS